MIHSGQDTVIHVLNDVDLPSSWLELFLYNWMPTFLNSSDKHTCRNYQPSKGRLIIYHPPITEVGFVFPQIAFTYLLLLIYYLIGFIYIQFVFTRIGFIYSGLHLLSLPVLFLPHISCEILLNAYSECWGEPTEASFPSCRDGRVTTNDVSRNCSQPKDLSCPSLYLLPSDTSMTGWGRGTKAQLLSCL